MNINSLVNKAGNALSECAQSVSNKITTKTATMQSKGVEPSKIWQYLDSRASGFLYFNRLNKLKPLFESFDKTIGMDNMARQHFYCGLEADTVQVGEFFQRTNDFFTHIQKIKTETPDSPLLKTLKQLVDMDAVRFTKLDISNPYRDLYFDDPDTLQKFINMIK